MTATSSSSDRLLESTTLYGVIGVISSSPDLGRVLHGVVDVLTKATRCHACFVYLRVGERLRLRAASPVYGHLVGRIEFGVDEGLAGWAVRRNSPAFVRENALDDPRTNYVPELEEERFQSMVAVPIAARDGQAIGVIVLHTVAPREFGEATLNVLVHTASLVAGAIENAQLYEDARRRVDGLTKLSALSQRIAAVQGREDLYRVATEGVRSLLGCDEARLYEMDPDRRRLVLVASDPPQEGPASAHASATAVLLGLLHDGPLDLQPTGEPAIVVPVAAGEEHLGVLVAAGGPPPSDDAEGLLRALANQVAVALKKAELIERLTEESIVRDLFDALEAGRTGDADVRAAQARCDLDRVHVLVHVERAPGARPDVTWSALAERAEARLRQLVPGAICDPGAECLRALLPLGAGGSERELRLLDEALAELGTAEGAAIGRSDSRHGAAEARAGLRESADAARVARALAAAGGALAYRDLGAYRYLVHVAAGDAPGDPYLDAVRAIAAYDRRRGTRLIGTLEQYLADRRGVTETARTLTVHPNTLRQRLERIEKLTGLDLAAADLLALELAIKLARLTPAS